MGKKINYVWLSHRAISTYEYPWTCEKVICWILCALQFCFYLIILFLLMLLSIAPLHHIHFSCKDLIHLTSRGCPSLYMKWRGHHPHLNFFSYWRWNLLVLETGERAMRLVWTWDSFRYVCMEHFGYYDYNWYLLLFLEFFLKLFLVHRNLSVAFHFKRWTMYWLHVLQFFPIMEA